MKNSLELIEKNVKNILENLIPYPNTALMAAIKTRNDEEICKAYECGVRYFGENRVQELLAHYETVKSLPDAKLHMIGTLQTNKVKYIIDKVDMIESLSGMNLAKEINKRASQHGLKMPVLIEVNIGREEQKDGIYPEELESFLDSLSEFKNIAPMGLMTIAPICKNPEDYAPYFSEMVHLRDNVFAKKFPDVKPLLSMGMSENYAEALRFGTNFVRIGTGIFGPRAYMTKFDVSE